MIRRFLAIAFSFVAWTAPAQTTADISVAVVADPVVDGNQTINWQIDVTNHGPGIAHDVQISGSSDLFGPGCFGVLTSVDPGTHTLVPCTTFAPQKETDVVLTAKAETISVDTPDPDLTNNVATKTIHATGGPDLSIFLKVPVAVQTITPTIPFDIGVSYANNSLTTAATGVTVTLAIPHGIHLTGAPVNCTPSVSEITCGIGTVPAHKLPGIPTPDFVITAVADEATSGQTLQFTGDIKGNEPETSSGNNHFATSAQVFRTFFVTDTAESLANAIDAANDQCTSGDVPCKIAFRLGTPPESGYFTIKPHRALPRITGKYVVIDGSTQTQLTGITNPNGPVIFIDGSENAWEDAFVFAGPCGGEVSSVAIGNFRNAAVTMLGSKGDDPAPCSGNPPGGSFVHHSYLGVDPTGLNAAPNGRGVVISEQVRGGTVAFNLISGNHRSGVWIGMANTPAVYSNTIGLDAHRQPLPNGASGVFAGPLVNDLGIEDNLIAFNHDFGISVDRRAIGVNMTRNSIFANLQLGIDIGLDGPTPERDVPAPVIVSAQYDPAQDRTIFVLSAHEPSLGAFPTVSLYANDAPTASGYGDGQYVLGQQSFDPASGGVTMSISADWRGKWATATVTRNDFTFGEAGHATTSEFSRAVKVE